MHCKSKKKMAKNKKIHVLKKKKIDIIKQFLKL
jgi:hypothetical protein